MTSSNGHERAGAAQYDAEGGNFRIMMGGDVMLTRRLAVYREPRYLALRDLLQQADAVFGNFESTAHDYASAVPMAMPTGGGTYMVTQPELLQDLKWLGVNLLSTANNHSCDYGNEGILANMQHLSAAGIAYAGTGRHLREARAPGYLDTAAGRVGLVAASASFNESHVALEQRVDMLGKPGISALGFDWLYSVTPTDLEHLQQLGQHLGLNVKETFRHIYAIAHQADWDNAVSRGEYKFLGANFTTGHHYDVVTRLKESDAEGIIRQVKEARRQADWVVVSVHSHEFGGQAVRNARERTDLIEPADYLKDFTHRVIDAGADVFVGHGPHITMGIEIYKGKPIFYSLGELIMQSEGVQSFPAHAYERFGLSLEASPADFLDARSGNDTKGFIASPIYWESVIADCQFDDGRLAAVRLHPIELGYRKPRPQRGRPMLAEGEIANQIVSRLERLSLPFGTRLERTHDGAQIALEVAVA